MLALDEMRVIGKEKFYKVLGLESSVRSCQGGGGRCLPLVDDILGTKVLQSCSKGRRGEMLVLDEMMIIGKP